jgi:GDP-mannose 6-dehydrogenase
MVDGIDTVLNHAQTIVVGNNDPAFRSVPERLRDDQVLVDFARITDRTNEKGKYDGICW